MSKIELLELYVRRGGCDAAFGVSLGETASSADLGGSSKYDVLIIRYTSSKLSLHISVS